MTAKFSQPRGEAFLAALRETGNRTLAAERAKVSQSWVQLHRSSDPPPSLDAPGVHERIMAKLEMFERQRQAKLADKLTPEQRAADEAAWARRRQSGCG